MPAHIGIWNPHGQTNLDRGNRMRPVQRCFSVRARNAPGTRTPYCCCTECWEPSTAVSQLLLDNVESRTGGVESGVEDRHNDSQFPFDRAKEWSIR